MLKKKELELFYKKVKDSYRPIIFFDDDPDGLCSYLLIQKFLMQKGREAKGVIVKGSPLKGTYWKEKYSLFDKVFILDKPRVEQEFLDKIKNEKIWLDHHTLPDEIPQKVVYLNPRIHQKSDGRPTTYWVYNALKKDKFMKKYEWLAAIGTTADYYFNKQFIKNTIQLFTQNKTKNITKKKNKNDENNKNDKNNKNHENNKKNKDVFENIKGLTIDNRFANRTIKTIEEALFTPNPLSILIRVFSFALQGKTSAINRNIRILERIEDPRQIIDTLFYITNKKMNRKMTDITKNTEIKTIEEIESMEKSTIKGVNKGIYPLIKHFLTINKKFTQILSHAEESSIKDSDMLVYTYTGATGLSSMISNHLSYKYPEKLVIICRKHGKRINCSLRNPKIDIRNILEKALNTIDGYGGGHEHACGANIAAEDFNFFIEEIKKEFKKAIKNSKYK